MSINNEDKSGYANVEIKPMLLENPYADLGLNRIKDKNANNTNRIKKPVCLGVHSPTPCFSPL